MENHIPTTAINRHGTLHIRGDTISFTMNYGLRIAFVNVRMSMTLEQIQFECHQDSNFIEQHGRFVSNKSSAVSTWNESHK